MIVLSQAAADLRDFFEKTEKQAQQFLAEHIPSMADAAQKAETDTLTRAALAASHLPDSTRQMLADLITKLDAEFPAPAGAPAAQASPAQA